jgi:small subunit ribosomal protein S8
MKVCSQVFVNQVGKNKLVSYTFNNYMDQIANMINMIKNGSRAEHELLSFLIQRLKHSIAECLVKEGFLKSATKKTKKGFPTLELGLAYVDGAPKVTGVERVSKSSRRVYKGVKEIKPTRNGYG